MQQNSLKGWREKEGLSKELLASKLNLTVSELDDLEKDSSRISKKKLERILALFNITYDERFCCKVFQKIYFSVKLRKKTERTE
ncbi:helix-turn-helix domain-containing protein [Lactococcus garvieae]|uniref:helix-turn-helix domain-containing protein n=1 Tax=Lactococcus garvieae TaxID=1363 RepID=UPI003853E4D1